MLGTNSPTAKMPRTDRAPYAPAIQRAIEIQSVPTTSGASETVGALMAAAVGAVPSRAWSTRRPSGRISGEPHRLQVVELLSSVHLQHVGQQTATGAVAAIAHSLQRRTGCSAPFADGATPVTGPRQPVNGLGQPTPPARRPPAAAQAQRRPDWVAAPPQPRRLDDRPEG